MMFLCFQLYNCVFNYIQWLWKNGELVLIKNFFRLFFPIYHLIFQSCYKIHTTFIQNHENLIKKFEHLDSITNFLDLINRCEKKICNLSMLEH